MRRYTYIQCRRSYACSQSPWNHKQRCEGKLQGTFSTVIPKGIIESDASQNGITKKYLTLVPKIATAAANYIIKMITRLGNL